MIKNIGFSMVKNNDLKDKNDIKTTLGKQTNFKGTMRFKNSLKIDGKFKGNIISDGFLYIEEGAVITADINVGSVIIGGMVKGNIEARENLELLSTARLFGNIKTAKLKIEDGVIFEGKCEMIKNGNDVNIFSGKIDEIKKSVKRV